MEELLEPYLKDTDLGLPYWDWTKNSEIPDLWENIPSPVKEWNEKRNTDFQRVQNNLDMSNCRSSSMNVALRNVNMNVLGNLRASLESSTSNAIEAIEFPEFSNRLQVNNIEIKASFIL